MMITSNQNDQLIVSPPQFRLESPGGSPFEVVPTISVTNTGNSFDFAWVQQPTEIGVPAVEGILEDMVQRSKRDAARFPSSPEAHANLGIVLANLGRLDEAADEFVIALRLSPDHFVSMVNLARIRTLRGQFEEAGKAYEEILDSYPEEPISLVNLSYIYLQTGKVEEATEVLEKAIGANSAAVSPRYLMAISSLKLGKTHEAIRQLRFAARTEVRSPAIHQALGLAYIMAGDAKGAVRSFKTALTLAPEMKYAVYALANVLKRQGHVESLIELLVTYTQRQPDDVTGLEMLSDAYCQLKQYPAARSQLTTALRLVQGDDQNNRRQRAKLLNNIGYCFDRQGDGEMSEQWFRRSIEVDPTLDAIPYHNLAKANVRKRQFTQAWDILEKCNRIFPENRETPSVQAYVLSEHDRYDEAINLLDRELAKGMAAANTYALLGWLLSDIRVDLDAARKILSEGVIRYSHNPLLVNNLAYTILLQGRPSEARHVLESAKFDEPLSSEERTALTATKGLLHLWEGDIEVGRRCYEQAENISHESSQKNLPMIVRQKMHLEVAKALLRQNNPKAAKSEVRKGLSIEGGRLFYERSLRSLESDLENE